jgi:hypothetical protein
MEVVKMKRLMKVLMKVTYMISIPFLSACAVNIEDYKDQQPSLELSQFFNGHLEAYGIVQDYKGLVKRRFTADIVGQWMGDKGLLDEQFTFDDGEQQHRCWRLQQTGKHYVGTAGDVIGQAIGKVSGNALNWQYQLSIPVDGRKWNLQLNDWMYLIDENNLINRATMSKFGIELGEITLYIRKVSATAHRPLTKNCHL